MAINDYNVNYKDKENVSVSITAFGSLLDTEHPDENSVVSFVYSDVLGVIATEKDGTSTNDIPKWVNDVDTSELSDEVGELLVSSLQDIYKQETTVAEIYLK